MAGKTHPPDYLADLLDKPRSWVMAHLHELPHLRVGREVRFKDEHITEILAAMERRPATRSDDTGLSDRSHARLQRRNPSQETT